MKRRFRWIIVGALLSLSGCAFTATDYSLQQALTLYARSDYEGAREKLLEYLQKYPDDPDGLFYMAKVENDGEKAAEYYRRFLTLYPEHPHADEATISLGKSLYTRGLYLSACDCFGQFVKRRRGGKAQSEARYWLATSYMAIERTDSALVEYEQLLKNDPYSDFAPLARLGVGDCRFLMGDYVAALEEYRRVENEHPESDAMPPALLGQGSCHRELGQEAQAEKAFQRLLKSYPESYEAKIAHGQCEIPLPQRDVPSQQASFAVQVGAFGVKENAERLRTKLVADGYEVQMMTRSYLGSVLYLVWVGTFATREEATVVGQRLESVLGLNYRIVER